MKPSAINTDLVEILYPTSMTVGPYIITLKAYREIAGHDDSTPYQAKVYVNNKELGVCYNDGRGGETNIDLKKGEDYKLLNEIAKYLKEHKTDFPAGEYYGIKIYYDNLPFICDHLAENCDMHKTLTKYANKKLVLYNNKTQKASTVSIKNIGRETIPNLLQTDEHFVKLWDDMTKKYQDQGYMVLNRCHF